MTTKLHDKSIGIAAIAGAAALSFVFATGSAMAADLPASVKALMPAAEKQGSLLVWGTTLNPRQIAAMKKDFNAYYGTSIDLNHKGGRQDIKAKQMAFAFKKGVPTGVDVFWTPVPKSLIDANALTAVASCADPEGCVRQSHFAHSGSVVNPTSSRAAVFEVRSIGV